MGFDQPKSRFHHGRFGRDQWTFWDLMFWWGFFVGSQINLGPTLRWIGFFRNWRISQQSIAMSMRNIIIPSIELLEFHDLTGRSLSVTDGHSWWSDSIHFFGWLQQDVLTLTKDQPEHNSFPQRGWLVYRCITQWPFGNLRGQWSWVATFSNLYTYDSSSTAQGGGGSFKNRKPIGELGCCESGMAERIHWWTERCLRSPLFLSLFLTIYLSIHRSIYLSTYLSIYLSLSSV